jgi:hypothetical protein
MTTMNTREEILAVLDRGAEDGVLPMLDNPYVYLAATRLVLYRSKTDWAAVFEVFGFAPRAGLPDLSVWTFASRLRDCNPPEKYRSLDAYRSYLVQHPNDESRFFHPIEASGWQDPANEALAGESSTQIVVRGESVPLPTIDDLARSGVIPARPPRISVAEVCRFLAETRRERVLGFEGERRVSVPTELDEILCLNEWTHPDLAAGERPSEIESVQQIAEVLSSGDRSSYRPTTEPNTHWSYWPDGGRS